MCPLAAALLKVCNSTRSPSDNTTGKVILKRDKKTLPLQPKGLQVKFSGHQQKYINTEALSL